ncbi:unnamed protein product [Periconia digitata]|uniref:Uncharacterized protein n=1 Tax=Periconia digitata TaxID=1303443 RepID=A0A9W4UKT8_9PLEO|nr:unnamed protein product [Periconia digitata]
MESMLLDDVMKKLVSALTISLVEALLTKVHIEIWKPGVEIWENQTTSDVLDYIFSMLVNPNFLTLVIGVLMALYDYAPMQSSEHRPFTTVPTMGWRQITSYALIPLLWVQVWELNRNPEVSSTIPLWQHCLYYMMVGTAALLSMRQIGYFTHRASVLKYSFAIMGYILPILYILEGLALEPPRVDAGCVARGVIVRRMGYTRPTAKWLMENAGCELSQLGTKNY